MARFGDLDTQYFDDAGDPLINGKVYFYETGTSTPKTTYSDVNFSIPNTNPVILTAAGRQPNVFFRGVAKAVLATSAGVQILVRDPVGETDSTFGNPWVSSKSYNANDVVQGSNGVFYVSLINGNVNNDPVTTSGSWTFLYSVEWSAGTTYKEGSVVTYDSIVYQSLQNANINKNPATETAWWVPIQLVWNSTSTYAINSNVVGTDGVLYTSLQNANTGNIPASSPLWWIGTSAAAAASASAALASENAAAASEASALASENAAAASELAAANSASAASLSEIAAALSESNAAASAIDAAASQSGAAAQVVLAAAQATASSASAVSSAGSATASSNSAAASAASASTAAAIANLSSVQLFTDPLAKSIRVGLAGSTSVRAPQVLDNANIDMGTSNFSVVVQKRITTTRPTANEILYHKHDGAAGVIVTLLTTGIVRLTLNAATFDSTVALTSASNVEPVIIIPVTRSSASAAGSVSFVVDGAQLGSAVSISLGAPTSVDNASNLYLLGTSTTTTEGSYYDGAIYNRALSVTECLNYCLRGPELADMGATTTRLYTSTFAVDADGFTGGGTMTYTGNTDGINGSDNWLKCERTSGGTTTMEARRPITFSNSTRRRTTITIFNPSGSPISYFRINSAVSDTSGVVACAANTEITVTVETSILTTETNFRVAASSSSGANATVGNGTIFYLKAITYDSIGLTARWPAFNAQTNTGQIFDQSGNKNHLLLPVSGATILGIPPDRRRQVRWTNTWSGTDELQYIGGVNQSILPTNAYIESIVGTVSGATPQDIIVGDGSDADRYVTITTALAAGTNTFTLASRTTDGTNLKLTVDPDAAATMSIAWVITYYRLEG